MILNIMRMDCMRKATGKINMNVHGCIWVKYYSQNGYNILNTEKLLSNKNSRQKRNKPDTKYIKVLAKNYNEAIQLLKDKGLLYET